MEPSELTKVRDAVARGIRQFLAALRGRPATTIDAIRVAFSASADDYNAAFQTYVRTQLAAQ